MKKLLHIFVVLLLLSSISFSQSGAAKSLEIGNQWVYRYRSECLNPYYYNSDTSMVELKRDTVINGKKYAVLNSQFQRADSISIFYFNIQDNSDREIVDFSTSNDSVFIYGKYRKRIIKRMDVPTAGGYYKEYIEGIGLTINNQYNKTPDSSNSKQLIACRINGVEYGETHLLDVESGDTLTKPNNFILSQNFPNPFNPTTQISYELPQDSDVELIVYNTLGKEVVKLVDKNQTVGKYTINWNGQNAQGKQMPGGIYFYTLKTKDFTQTKKMLLLR